MAEQKFNVNCGFFDAVDNDRLYTADEMNKPYKRVISNGVFATPLGTPSTDLQVISANSGMNILVKKGEGLFGDKWFESPSDLTITVPNNTNIVPRRDSVIVQVDKRINGRTGNIVYREGTPSSNPQVPDINTVANVIEYRIANIYVAPNANYIGNDGIVDLRGSSECPWITALIKQVDTSQLYNQWQAAYQKFYTDETEAFQEFMRQLTEELTVNTNIETFESHYVTTTDGQTEIPINLVSFNKNKDTLMVRINKLFASEGTDYTISLDSSKITLTKDLMKNQNVDFLVLKSIVGADNETAIQQLQTLNESVSALTSDGGWINFTLEGGATAYDNNNKPAVRKYGNRTNIRGAIKGVTATGTTICTLPAAYKPAMDYYFTTSAIANGTVKSTVTFQVLASSGQVKLVAKSGTIAATDMISIATNFIVG
ncbi:MAG: hypothetical protein MJ245_00195 [Clostridia bacterium]|nr:hypothetical protein [Clostridia bacterium]